MPDNAHNERHKQGTITMAARDWSGLFRDHKGQWVALRQDQKTVIAAAPTLAQAMSEAERMGFADPIMTKVPKRLELLVG
ncbi:DUF5678 domain-containing protein [Streptomyces hokutonensis]|uniref:DUF5678 domain-containing protein n=1 Tax=Streptomyces hokutonensis TaxID=1306990 RepID=UPI00380B4926